jgi:hypothetical protein
MRTLLWKFADDFLILLASLLGTLIRSRMETGKQIPRIPNTK